MSLNALMSQAYNMIKKRSDFFSSTFLFLYKTTYRDVKRYLSDGTKGQRASMAFTYLVHILWSFPALMGYD